MPYALFENETKLSRAFTTEMEVWQCAEENGLVIDDAQGKKQLENHYTIKSCAPDIEETEAQGVDLLGLNKLT